MKIPSKENLIIEEQEALDKIIDVMDRVITDKNHSLQRFINEAKAARGGNTDAICNLGVTQKKKDDLSKKIHELQKSRDELYRRRVKVLLEDYAGNRNHEEYKIGLHAWHDDLDNLILSWKDEVGRHFLMDQAEEVFSVKVKDKFGDVHNNTYHLEMDRSVDLFFTQVRNATHLFPLTDDEAEQLVYDEFLQELLERRSSAEFQNIVFSIQKQQGEIIQAPFRKHMIVQGCAGSGKSMIMLHRLPILMYDNPNELDFSNIYTITPSEMYIQMASNMLAQLEISNLRMGTMQEYLTNCIKKYGYSAKDYGVDNKIGYLDKENAEYVYSDKCIEDIKAKIEVLIDESQLMVDAGISFFGLQKKVAESNIPAKRIATYSLNIQRIINKNSDNLKLYYLIIKNAVDKLNSIKSTLINRKSSIEKELRKKIDESNKQIKKYQVSIANLDPERNARAIENKVEELQKELEEKKRNGIKIEKLNEDTHYFNKLNDIALKINAAISLFPDLRREFISDNVEVTKSTYNAIEKIQEFVEEYYYIYCELDELEDSYTDVVPSLNKSNKEAASYIEQLEKNPYKLLPEEYYLQMLQKSRDLRNIDTELPRKVFWSMVHKVGMIADGSQRMFEAAPYLLLQVLYQFKGVPNAKLESLITIDEAQGFTRAEYELIKNVNDNKIIFNLFGDEKQHIEGTKGLDSWNEIVDLEEFIIYDMRDNYRNARQITNYCNNKFDLNMRAINLDGTGYYEAESKDDFIKVFNKQMTSAKQGLCAIIVKDSNEIKKIVDCFKQYKSKINDLSAKDAVMNLAKWNVMTVADSKGLEFTSVITLLGNMTHNEKYIACTRALDELIICDIPIEQFTLWNRDLGEPIKINEETIVTTDSIINVKNALIEKDLEVIDLINEAGELWVIGARRKLGNTVDAICEKYGVKATYTLSKATGGKPGCVIRLNDNKS